MNTSEHETMRRRLRAAAVIAALGTIFGLLLFAYRALDDLTRAHYGMLSTRFIEEMTGAYGGALLFPGLVWLARRWPLDRGHWLARLPAYVVGVVAFSLAHTSLNAISRDVIFPLAGLGAYDYGILWIRYFMEFPSDLLWYTLVVWFVYLFDHYRAARDHELRAAQLESRLAQAQLQNLRLQLQPHFLFNALNTISAAIFENPRAADAMLGKLSTLLRHTLQASHVQETTLDDEVGTLRLYVDLMQARLEERLAVRIDVDPAVARALVPQLILQPLVENAIRHGGDAVTSRIEVEVRCARENGSLLLEVRDHGAGLAAPADAVLRSGIGLANTAGRLRQLYGAPPAHELRLRNAEEGGLRVSIAIPYRDAGELPTLPSAARVAVDVAAGAAALASPTPISAATAAAPPAALATPRARARATGA